MTTITVERDIRVPMRDGVNLIADIYRPATPGAHPVLLNRSPYDRRSGSSGTYRHPEWWALRGYIVVHQDVRGRYASEGEWYPFRNESDDGFDSVEWAAALPGSNGRVGMYGFSYNGATQMLAAVASPPHLAAIVPGLTGSDYYQAWTYEGGAFSQAFIQSWALGLAEDAARRMGMADTLDDILQQELAIQRVYGRLPITDLGVPELREVAPYYFDWLEHDTWDDYWQAFSIPPRHGNVGAAALHVAGWYDVFLEGTLQNYEGLRAKAATPEARQAQRLVVGPWHHMPWSSFPGGYDFGEEGGNIVNEEMLRWYDRHLKGEQDGVDAAPPVRLFVMGENRWRDEDAWPLQRAVDTNFFLHSGGGANSRNGDGTLSQQRPGDEPYDLYMHRPGAPVPSLGGHSCCDENVAPQGAYDQRKVEDRFDVLCFTGDVLRDDLEVTGWVSCRLFGAADAVDTDWCAKLVDVFPDGTALNITDGVIRARYRDSLEHTSPIEPGKVYEYTIAMRATSNVFKAGHRLRLEVASSNHPMYDRNPCTGGHSRDVTAADFRPVTHRVFHDGSRASYVVLPVVARW